MQDAASSVRDWPDLSPRPDAKLEWWYLAGYIEGDRIGRREFMFSLFRQKGSRGGDGHMLLASALDPATGESAALSQVSPAFVDNFLCDTRDDIGGLAIDPLIVDAYLKEIAAGGPPAPIRLEAGPVETALAPFAVSWSDFCLARRGDALELELALPAAQHCRVIARPRAPWFKGRDIGAGEIGAMDYDCCPRLDLVGTADDEPIRGQCWLDHQWGGYGWLRTPKGGGILGWTWFGISLEGGVDLLVAVHLNAATGAPVHRLAVVFEPGAEPYQAHDITLSPLGIWQSRATMIDYPVAWRIEIPSLALDLAFTPAAQDQEIQVFGLMNAIWQGAGRVNGTFRGRPASGRSRLELHGYGFLQDFKDYQGKLVERIERRILQVLPKDLDQASLEACLGPPRWQYDAAAQTDMLATPVWDLLERGGKHWRPVFGLLLLEALGADVRPYEEMMSVIPELVHNGSVVVDDIEDASLKRRGEATLHLRYGMPTALNAANTLYFLPLLTIGACPELSTAQRDAIYRILIEMYVQAHFGQAQDLYLSKLDGGRRGAMWCAAGTGDLILQSHAFKSAAAVRAVADVACVIAGASRETRSVVTRLAESWGVAFQMVDDVNNFSTSPRWGKERGEDVAAGKFSYAIYRAVQLSEGVARERLVEILATARLHPDAGHLAEAIALIESSGALDAVRREAKAMVEADWPAFSRALPATRAKLMLRILLTTLLDTPFEM
jgi:geranylgeranyl pyrophosphate synthase/predicted secreted hydrolase